MVKIGFLDRSDASWTAGASYSRSMVNALAAAAPGRCEVCVLGGANSPLRDLPAGVRDIRSDAPRLTPAAIRDLVREHGIDALLPVTEVLFPDTPCALVGWIPDFQHRRLPQYFTDDQCAQRDRHFGYLIGNCDAMMFSSQAVLGDFRELYPSFSGPSASVHFASSFAWQEDIATGDPTGVVRKYSLPEGFALVANQFWKHKNHRLVLDAVAQARRREPRVHVVMVGMLSDSRDVANPHISDLIRKLSTERLFENITVLGEVPFGDLVALLRCATLVIQPSEFEGWNTTVEDALALGKPVSCSDIPSHREQAPEAFFFPVSDSGPLADVLAGPDWSKSGWSGVEAEEESLRAERERGAQWAAGLIELCERAAANFREHARSRAQWSNPIDKLRANPLAYIEHLESQNERLTRGQERLELVTQQLQEARQKAAELREQLQASRGETRAALDKFWREKSKPLRERLREEWLRFRGRRLPDSE